MSDEPPKDDEPLEPNRCESLYERLYTKDGARRTRLPSSMFPWLPNGSVLYGGKVKLTGDDVKKIYGITKAEYDKVTRNFKLSPDYCFYIMFTQGDSDDKMILALEDKIIDLEGKVDFYKSGFEITYGRYLELAEKLRKYEDVDLR